MYKVKLTEFVNKMNLKSLLPDIDTDSIMIEQSAVNRLALQLAGFFEHFDSERIQVIGNVEAEYDTKQEAMKREYAIKQLSRQKKLALIRSHQSIF